jgi:hypothetical protein
MEVTQFCAFRLMKEPNQSFAQSQHQAAAASSVWGEQLSRLDDSTAFL